MRLVLMGVSAIVFGASACHRSPKNRDEGVAVGSVINRHMLAMAGQHAVNCGWSDKPSEFARMRDCALQASQQATPFVVQFRVQGIDSVGQVGFAATPEGRLVTFGQTDGSFRPGQVELLSADCVPGSLRVAETDILTCEASGLIGQEREKTYASHFYSSRR